ncbi:hypothetical protein Axi01nite_62440 [Actinoplanes xinjiangensis]|nr:hypothetical protein Axi01nite_62440 [Actinoplanes xinjiangensis]
MRSPEPSASTHAHTPKHGLTVGAAGVVIAVAVLGAAVTARADGDTPSPASSDDTSYQLPAPRESAPMAQLVDRDSADPNTAQPADLTPEELQRITQKALAEEAARRAALPNN